MMMKHTLSALLTAAALAAPALAEAQPPRGEVRVHKSPAEVAAERERQRERARAGARSNQAAATERVSHTFTIGGSGELHVSNVTGDITINRGRGNDIRVEAVKTATGRTEAQAREVLPHVRVDFIERAGRAEVRAVHPREHVTSGSQRNSGVSVAYTITAPEGTRVNVRTLTGDIRVTGIKGELSLVSMTGDLVITDAERVSSAVSTAGDIQLHDVQSDRPVEIKNTAGDITVRDGRMPRLHVSTVSGTLRIQNVQVTEINAQSLNGDLQLAIPFAKNGRYDLNTHNGDIDITVVGGSGFEVDANTFSGDVRTSLQLSGTTAGASERRGGSRRLRGRYGDGGALLDITTFAGDVTIK